MQIREDRTFEDQKLQDIQVYEPLLNLDTLRTELSLFRSYKEMHPEKNWESFDKLVEVFGLNMGTLQYQYPQVFKLLNLYRTVPISSATAERSFRPLHYWKPGSDLR